MIDSLQTTNSLFARIKQHWQQLSTRERNMSVCAILVLFFIASTETYSSIKNVFISQQERFSTAQTKLDLASAALSRYGKLRGRQRAIEENFKGVDSHENLLSYLETLLKEKAGVASGFSLKDKPPQNFGGNYEQTTYAIRFTTVDYKRLLEFLKELTQGARPLILTSLDVKPRPTGDSVEVELEVSSIRKSKEDKLT